jgi:hypothetical protein
VKRWAWLAVLVVASAVAGSSGDSVQASSIRQHAPTSTEVAALRADGRVVVLNGKTGREKRTLARGAMTDEPGVTVDADGVNVYFTRPMANPPCVGLGSSGDVPEIVRVARVAGRVETLTPPGDFPVTGFHPIISPSGQNIAFMGAPCGSGLLAQFHLPTPRTPAGPVWCCPRPKTVLKPIAWSSDSQRILFEAVLRDESEARLLVTGATAGGPPAATVFGLEGYIAATYRRDVLVVAQKRKTGFSVVEVDEEGVRGLFRGKGPSPISMEFDASGRELLYVADGKLFRWRVGEKAPKKLADGVVDAAWA